MEDLQVRANHGGVSLLCRLAGNPLQMDLEANGLLLLHPVLIPRDARILHPNGRHHTDQA